MDLSTSVISLAGLVAGDHVACLDARPPEVVRASVEFTRLALAQQHRVVLLTSDQAAEQILSALQGAGVDTAGPLKDGTLTLLPAPVGLAPHSPSPAEGLLDQVRELISDDQEGQESAVHLALDLCGLADSAVAPEALAAFERQLDDLCRDAGLQTLCFYSPDALSPEQLETVVYTHRFLLYGGTILRNPHFSPSRAGEAPTSLMTERLDQLRAAHAHVADRERAISALLNATADLALLVDAEGTILACNEAMAHHYGASVEEMVGTNLASLMNEPVVARRQAIGLEVLRTGQPLIFEDENDNRWGEHSLYPVRDAQGRVAAIAIYSRDVTAKYALREEALKAQKLAALELLSGGVAHDFNNLLQVVLGNLQVAQHPHAGPEKIRQALANAERAGMRARDLTRQFVNFSRAGADTHVVLCLADLVHETATLALSGSRHTLQFTAAPHLWPTEVDVAQMGQVVHNLVLNALQAMPEGGTIWVSLDNQSLTESALTGPLPGQYVRMIVRDEGQGMAAAQIRYIFEPYYTTKHDGVGLGLSNVLSIITHHGGHITVDSEPGQGATFTVYLPAAGGVVGAPEEDSAEAPGGSERVLFMDDDEGIRELARDVLADLGYSVQTASCGEEALTLYAAALDEGQPYDAVLLDLTVQGGAGGRETICDLLEMDPLVRAIVCTGHTASAVVARPADYGFRAVITKPFDLADLARTLRRVLDEQR
jgi:PAS domain S-box-containing protein